MIFTTKDKHRIIGYLLYDLVYWPEGHKYHKLTIRNIEWYTKIFTYLDVTNLMLRLFIDWKQLSKTYEKIGKI